jgi:hypothetical protein
MINSSDYEFGFTHLLVDEFQDISSDRNRLIESMKKANPKLEVTCVGDDWQSIYRFSGSDVSIMREASKPKMIRKRVDLTATYRLPQIIADISRSFILKNPLQLEKSVYSKSDLDVPGKVITHWDMQQKENEENLILVIERIGEDAQDPSKSIRVLLRCCPPGETHNYVIMYFFLHTGYGYLVMSLLPLCNSGIPTCTCLFEPRHYFIPPSNWPIFILSAPLHDGPQQNRRPTTK